MDHSYTNTKPEQSLKWTAEGISAVLFDIDDTLTYYKDDSAPVDECEIRTGEAFVDAAGQALSFDQVQKRIQGKIEVFSDTAPTIKALHKAGLDLYTASTNACTIARAKLSLAGLAHAGGSPYFKGMLGGSQISPPGKASSRFFTDLLAHYTLNPQSVMHVGDHMVFDIEFARDAGITHVIQIDRAQKEPVLELHPTGLSINSLNLLPSLLGLGAVTT